MLADPRGGTPPVQQGVVSSRVGVSSPAGAGMALVTGVTGGDFMIAGKPVARPGYADGAWAGIVGALGAGFDAGARGVPGDV